MLHNLFGGGCGCNKGGERRCFTKCFNVSNSSCDVLWIILLLMVVFNGGLFGIDICTLIILLVVFGGQFLCGRGRGKGHGHGENRPC